jgi:hypothetical protein
VKAYFVSHGEEASTLTFAGLLAKQAPGARVIAPKLDEVVDLLDEAAMAQRQGETQVEVAGLEAQAQESARCEEPSES